MDMFDSFRNARKCFEILAVDDDSLILEIMKIACKPIKLRTAMHTAPCAHDAIEMSRRQRFDMLCLDHDLEGIKGWELLDFLRPHLPSNVQVLVYSSHVDAASRQAYSARGVTDILEKPLTPMALGFAIRKILNV